MEKAFVKLGPGLQVHMFSDKLERLQIVPPYCYPKIADFSYETTMLSTPLFGSLGMMYLISPYLPEIIKTNFPVPRAIRRLMREMYLSKNHEPPDYEILDNEVTRIPKFKTSNKKVAIAYSGGVDSMWNYLWAQEKYGPENVLVVHIDGLNHGNARDEKDFSDLQAKEIGFKHYTTINLVNSSTNSGYEVMRSRDFFLTGIIMPLAIEFGASRVITEGFAETESTAPYSGQEKNMKFFNEVIERIGIPVRVAWRNKKEMDIVKDLVEYCPDWLQYVCNCFSKPHHKIWLREKNWKVKARSMYNQFYESQCGSCPKCRKILISRILYDPQIDDRVKIKDVLYYLENTIRWVRDKLPKHSDMIMGTLLRDIGRACRKYGVSTAKLPA